MIGAYYAEKKIPQQARHYRDSIKHGSSSLLPDARQPGEHLFCCFLHTEASLAWTVRALGANALMRLAPRPATTGVNLRDTRGPSRAIGCFFARVCAYRRCAARAYFSLTEPLHAALKLVIVSGAAPSSGMRLAAQLYPRQKTEAGLARLGESCGLRYARCCFTSSRI